MLRVGDSPLSAWAGAGLWSSEELGPNDAWCLAHTHPEDLPSGRHGSVRAGNVPRDGDVRAWLESGCSTQCFFDGHVELLSPAWVMDPHNHQSWSPLTGY